MELKQEKVENKPKMVLWSGIFILQTSEKTYQTLCYLAKGMKETEDGIEHIKNFDKQKTDVKIKTWIQNNARTVDVTTGDKWQEFVDAVFKKIEEEKIEGE